MWDLAQQNSASVFESLGLYGWSCNITPPSLVLASCLQRWGRAAGCAVCGEFRCGEFVQNSRGLLVSDAFALTFDS